MSNNNKDKTDNRAKLKNSYVTRAPAWFLSDGDFYKYDGAEFIVGRFAKNVLPVEFFNHQLVDDYDPECDDDIIKLCASFGIPRLPRWRFFGNEENTGVYYERRREAIRLSDKADKKNHAEAMSASWVSLEEARLALRDLQEWSRTLFEWLKGDSDEWAARTIVNKTARAKEIVPCHKLDPEDDSNKPIVIIEEDRPTSTLTEAVCTQIIDTFASVGKRGLLWRKCKRCGRWYVRFQPREGFPKTDKAPNRSYYCCHNCKVNQTQKNYRDNH